MNVKGSEFSIFQGAPSIHVDNNQQRVEEEEAEQDRIRRNAELNNELQTAFEDLDEDFDANGTMNSTKFSNQHSINNNPIHYRQNHDFPLRDEESQLRNLLDSKTREIEYLSSQLSSERMQNKSTVEEYEKRLAIANAEKERAEMTRDQTHELLVENKSELIEIQETREKLQTRIRTLESENSKLVGELESTKYMLQDIQLKYNMVEKNVIINADKNTDKILKQAHDRHTAQLTVMQQQVESLQSKFDDLEHEYKNLDIRYKELQRSRESMLIEKSEIINQMNRSLEDSQRQCQELLARPNLAHENRQLQNILKSIESEKNDLNVTILKLQKKLNDQQQEMEMMDSIVQECGGINVSFSESMKFINREPLKNVNSSTPVGPEARLARVKDELCRSLSNIKNKREELKICEKQLAEKDKEIKELRMDENKALAQMNHWRDEAIRHESKAKVLEKELEEMRQELKAIQTYTNDEKITKEMTKMQKRNEELESELNNLKMDFEKLTMKNDELMDGDREWKKIVAELEGLQDSSKIVEELEKEKEKVQKLNDELKKLSMIEKVDRETQKDNRETSMMIESTATSTRSFSCQKCDEFITKLEKLEISCLQLQNSNAENLSCLRDTRRQLEDANRVLQNYEEKLSLKKMRDDEIEKLTRKAREFEEYMRTQTTKNGSFDSSTKSASTPATCSDVSTETTADLLDVNSREVEKRTRDEMAKLFAFEMKTMEKQFNNEVERLKMRIVELTEELNEITHESSVRQNQVELLKATIMHERENSKKLLNERDIELEECQQKLEQIVSRRVERDETWEAERESFEARKKHFEHEVQTLHDREKEWQAKIRDIQEESSKMVEDFKNQYLSMKRTAMNYKQYSQDKENYYKTECERITEKQKEKLKIANANMDKHYKDKIEGLETMYEARIKRIQDEHDIQMETLKKLLHDNKFA